jgi:GT2 family glycosyltransferase
MICARGGAELTEECADAAGASVPDVSIIVLTHNALAATRRCVASLRAHTGASPELILVDNGSAADTVAFLRETAAALPACRLILSPENLGFAAGNNLGLAAARGRDVVLVNSDVVVTPGWLERLLACADAHPGAGLVGPCTNRISGPQQVAPVDYDQDSLAGLDDWAARFAAAHAGQASPHWRAVGFCVLIRRPLLETIGGLDPRFGRGNFEDDDYALRARLGGFESWIAADCFVHHDGGRSFAAAGIDLAASLEANWEIFKAKWGLPATAPYGQPVQVGQYVRRQFEPARDRIPLAGLADHAPPSAADNPTATAADTDNATAQVARGEDLYAAGLFAPAACAFRAALAADPAHARAGNDLACALWRLGQGNEALAVLCAILARDASDRDAAWNLGQFLSALGRHDDAARLYSAFLVRHPDAPGFAAALQTWGGQDGPWPGTDDRDAQKSVANQRSCGDGVAAVAAVGVLFK